MSDFWQPDPEQYTNDPYEQQAMLEWLLSMSKPELSQARSALTGVGTDLTNQGKVLGIENKMLDNQNDILRLAMNPLVGQLSGAYDPMAMPGMAPPGMPMGGGFNPMGGGMPGTNPQMPFEASGFSPLRTQWQTANTPAAQAVLAMFDQIDQGQDPSTLIQQYTQATGGALDVPHPALGMTGKEMLQHAQDYWEESQQRNAAQAQYQFEAAQQPMPGMEGVDPTLGSFSEPMVAPAIGETLVGNQMDVLQQGDPAREKAMMQYLQRQTQAAVGDAPSTPRLEDMTPQQLAEIKGQGGGGPGIIDRSVNDLKNLADWFGQKVGGMDSDDPRLFHPDKPQPRRFSEDEIRGSVAGAIRGVTGGSKRMSKPKPKRQMETKQQRDDNRQRSASAATSRLSRLEDSERKRLGIRPRDTGKSVGQANLEARLSYLRGQPYPG